MSRVIAFDTETFYQKNHYGIRELGAWHYTHSERFDCYLVSVCDGAETWAGHPRDFNWDSLSGATLLAHNAAFDSAVLARLQELGTAPKFSPIWYCTANLSAYCTKRRSLSDAVKHVFQQDISKDMRDFMSGKTWADAVAAGKDKEMLGYARRDAFWCWKLWDKLSPQWPESERRLSDLTIRSGARGVRIDTDKLRTYLHAAQAELLRIEVGLPWYKEAKPTSTKAMAEACNKAGIPCPPVKDDDEDAFLAWEAAYGPRFPWIKDVSDWRSVNKVLGTLQTIQQRLRPDDTIEAPLLYFGAHTGRWSGTGGLNFQNLRKDPLMCGETAIDIRSLIVPRPGTKMIISDLSQIEPRVLAWLCGNTEFMAMVRSGMSVYEAHARKAMGWKGGELKKENPTLYKTAKAQVLGLGYGCGAEKFVTVAKLLADLDVSPEDSVRIVQQFREDNKPITDLWRTLDTAFKRSVADKVFEMALPSGRVMRYENVKPGVRPRKDKETGKVTMERAVFADVLKSGRIQRLALYGGILTENITQGLSRDVFAYHLLKLEDAGHDILFSSHDEAALEVAPDVTPKDVERIMSECPEWLEGCPIAAEAIEAPHYKK